MNDRIKQLIMEAVNFRLDPDSDAYEAQICPEDLEYLAELIVRECAEFTHPVTRKFIFEHFGVEE